MLFSFLYWQIISLTFSIFPHSIIFPILQSIHSGLPPVLYVITYVPQASASKFVVGKLSSYVGFKKISAVEYKLANSSKFSVFSIVIILFGISILCFLFIPTKTIWFSLSIIFDNLIKSFYIFYVLWCSFIFFIYCIY